MKFNALAFLAVATAPAAAFQPATPLSMPPAVATSGSTSLNMVLEKPKQLSKLEILKTQSDHLENPLREVREISASMDIFSLSFVLLVSAQRDLHLHEYDQMPMETKF